MNLQQAALAAQWSGKDFQLRPCCPLCRGLEAKGHAPECVIGMALKPEPLTPPAETMGYECNRRHENGALLGWKPLPDVETDKEADDHMGNGYLGQWRRVGDTEPRTLVTPPINDGDGLIYEHISKSVDPHGHAAAVAESMATLDDALVASTVRSWRQHAGLPDSYPLHNPTHVEVAMEKCIAELGLVLGATRRKALQYKREAAKPVNQLAHGHRGDWYLMANAQRLALEPIARIKSMPNWILARELFATGSTSARQICLDAGVDPDSTDIKRAGGI